MLKVAIFIAAPAFAGKIGQAMRALGTVSIWIVTTLVVVAAAGLAFVLVYMPFSLDPTDLVAAGSEPWMDALYAGLGFLAVLAMGIISLRAWHSARLKPVAIVLTLIETAAVGWVALWIYDEYF